MNKLIIFAALMFICVGAVWAQQSASSKVNTTKDFASLWADVDKIEKDNLPQSAIEAIDIILNKAIREKNTQQVIKSLIFKNKNKIAIDSDISLLILNDLESLLQETSSVTDRSLLHSLLAELYQNYYTDNQWLINERTNLIDYVPKDMNEWSQNIYENKILEHLNASVKEESKLLNASTHSYQDIIILGSDSEKIYPTLYDFLMQRNIELMGRLRVDNFQQSLARNNINMEQLVAPTEEFVKLNIPASDKDLTALFFYSQFLNSLLERNLTESIILTELSKISYLSGKSSTFRKNNSINALTALFEQYKANEASVEIISQIVSFYSNQTPNWRFRDTSPNKEETELLTKAYNWCIKGIELYPNYKRINLLKSQLALLETPTVRITANEVYHPNQKDKSLNIRYKNIRELNLNISKVVGKGDTVHIQTLKVDFDPKTSYLAEEKNVELNLDKAGEYIVEFVLDQKDQSKTTIPLLVSEVAAFSRAYGERDYEFYVVDRISGHPIENATIVIEKDDKAIDQVKTDKQGLAIYTASENLNTDYSLRFKYRFNVFTPSEKVHKPTPFPYGNQFRSRNTTSANNADDIVIFTDRSIYRPGQTVYFKAISSAKGKDESKSVIANREYEVFLYDVNQQIVSKNTFTTNEFGSLSGDFTLPQSGLTGGYNIKINNAIKYFNVEEYKRPTFQITFDGIEKTYTFGDKVTIKGHAESFSGVKLENANVDFSVTRQQAWLFRGAPSELIESGSIVTDKDGAFSIDFTIPMNDSSHIPWWRQLFNFNITSSITDINGETQSGDYSFPIGNVSMILSVDIPSQMDKDVASDISIKATNLNGKEIAAQGNYVIYSTTEEDKPENRKEVLKADFVSGVQKELKNKIKSLASGRYVIKLQAKDDGGRTVENESVFVLYASSDKRPPIVTNEWLLTSNNTFNESKPAEIIFGVSAKNAIVLFDLMKNDKLLERKQLKLSNENIKLPIPYKAEYEDGVNAILTYVIDGKSYLQNIDIRKTKEVKNLTLKLEVFRDKLRPAQQEEWRISVKDNVNKPAFAEVLASMYDSSLDKISSADIWAISPEYPVYFNPSFFQTQSFDNTFRDLYIAWKSPEVPILSFDTFNWFGFSFDSYKPIRYGARTNNRIEFEAGWGQTGHISAPAPMADMAVKSKTQDLALSSPEEDVQLANGGNTNSSSPQIRRNFDETAFFYPFLKTDQNGETIVSFLVPDVNTTWKFRAFAHDKSFKTGNLESLVISQKELMITPNIPRFLRQGDKTNISTKISNLSENSISGKVRIEFFDPMTEKTVNITVINAIQSFEVDKSSSVSANWTFDIPTNMDMLGLRIIAESENFSDGEQHAVAVLPNRMLVTESMPMDIGGNSSKSFVFEKLANTKSTTQANNRLTLEFSSNPAWYAIQALPVINNPTNDNSVNWFASYYANTLGKFITVQYPKVSSLISVWKKQNENEKTLLSNLMKNEELKAVLLEETPWVLDAQNETEQMERLSHLLNLNNSQQQANAAIAKLQELQNSDGGWSWCKGMSSNRGITQYILYGFSQLINLNAVEYPSNVKEMQISALKFIDSNIVSDFENLKKNNKKWAETTFISTNQLEYMFVRSSYRDIPISHESREAERFYNSVAEKNWTKLNLYERSLLAMLAHRNGNKELTAKITKSIREHSTINGQMGMFWANNRSNMFISQSAVTTHVFLMDALKETGSSVKEMDNLKQWLIKQKQTQIWESTHATVDAIYALLGSGTDWFTNSGDVKIQIGSELVEPLHNETISGYVKRSWDASEIIPSMSKVEVSKATEGPAYGALYLQYYEDMDKIEQQKSSVLNVEKRLFVETIDQNKRSLNQVSENNPLKVGDRVIVRLTVKTDRDMEFVQLKDMRASCFEPVETLSGIKWQNGLAYYESVKDGSTNMFFDNLPKGTYVFEYPVYVNRTGKYSNGITTIQCMYAPEFTSHTQGIKVVVK